MKAANRSQGKDRTPMKKMSGFLAATMLALLALPFLGASAQAAPVSGMISGEIERITINNPDDFYSGGRMVVGGQPVILPRNLQLDLPANRLTLQQLFAQAPAACVARGESGLAKADVCNSSMTGGFATVHANRTNAGDNIAGDVFIEKGTEAISGLITFIDYSNGYFRVNGVSGSATAGLMVRLNDPVGRHTVQQGPGCLPGAENCSPDPRFTLDPDNYTAAFTTGYPMCIPSTVARPFVDVLDLDKDGNTTETLTAQSAPDGTGDLLCPIANRTTQPVNDSRLFAPILVGDGVTVEGNFETINGVRFVSSYAVTPLAGLQTKNDPSQPDYFIFDEVFVDAPGFNNQRARTLFIGYMTIAPTDVLIWSLHRDANNVPHEFPLATTLGCDNAGGVGTCTAQGFAPGVGGNIFKIRHDVDFLVGAKPKVDPCAHLRADPRFAALNVCPQGGTMAEMFSIFSPTPHEIMGRTGRKLADDARPGGPLWKTLDITGQEVPNGQYLFPFGIGLGGVSLPEFVEIDLNALNTPNIFEGLPWLLDGRLGPNGCDGACPGTPQPLDPFPFSGLDPRTQAPVPTTPYNDPAFTASQLNFARDRMLSFVDPNIGNFNGNSTVLSLSLAVDPAAQGLAVTPSLFQVAGSVSPAEGATGVAVTTPVTATFSEEMYPASLGATTFTLVKQGTTAAVPASVSYDTAARRATLVPSANLEANAVYTATVKGGATGAKGLTGFSLAADKVWSFTTAAAAPAPAAGVPTVVSVSPAHGDRGVAVTTRVTAAFSEAMAPASLSASTFTLVKRGTTTPVAASVSYDVATNTATLTPSASLEAGVTYTATVAGGPIGARDLAGTPLATSIVWSFVTASPLVQVPAGALAAGAFAIPLALALGSVVAIRGRRARGPPARGAPADAVGDGSFSRRG